MCEQRATVVRRAGQYWPVLAVALGLYTVGGPSCSTTNVKCSSMVETPAQRVAACVAPSVVLVGAGTLSPESSSSPAPSHVVRGPDGLLASHSYPQSQSVRGDRQEAQAVTKSVGRGARRARH